jgi:diguanylate cyclase (GGDEF)-like protein
VPTQEHTEHAETLTRLWGDSKHVMEQVNECARELALINAAVKQELAHRNPSPELGKALEQSQAIAQKLCEASAALTATHRTLESEIRDRNMVDHQLAAAIEQQEDARHAAFHDVLTGLPNRALFNDRLELGMEQAKRYHRTLAVMFIDLDKFKVINDTYGHETGDCVLRVTAQRLKDNTRHADSVSRTGGDEFLYLLTEIHSEMDLANIAAKIINAIRRPCEVRVNDLNITPTVGASIGIAIFPRHGATAGALINSADAAMFRAKLNGSGYAIAL